MRKPRLLAALALPLAGCPDSGTDKVGPVDTSTSGCDRVHDALGVLQLVGDTWSFPTDAPDPVKVTTAVAGPFSDGSTWIASYQGTILQSGDDGCNWDKNGGGIDSTLDWGLLVAGDTAYAWDRGSDVFAMSVDGAMSWSASSTGAPLFGSPVADSTVAGKLRGMTAGGLVGTEDDGVTWTPLGTPPPGAIAGAAVFPGNLDVAAVTYSGGVAITKTAGASWEDIGTPLVDDGFIGRAVAFSPDSEDSVWAVGQEGEDIKIKHTSNAGTTWTDVATSRSIDLSADAGLWPVAGNVNEAYSAYGTTDDGGQIEVYHMIASENLHTNVAGTYTHINDLAIRDDGGLLLAVDGVK